MGIEHGHTPCHSTYHHVFQSISASDLVRALGALVHAGGPLAHIAIDGKRPRQLASPGMHILQAFSTRLHAAVSSLAVPPDSATVEALKLIRELPFSTRSGDGRYRLHLPQHCEAILMGVALFLLLKVNQPEVEAELRHAFGDVPLDTAVASLHLARAHWQIENRLFAP